MALPANYYGDPSKIDEGKPIKKRGFTCAECKHNMIYSEVLPGKRCAAGMPLYPITNRWNCRRWKRR